MCIYTKVVFIKDVIALLIPKLEVCYDIVMPWWLLVTDLMVFFPQLLNKYHLSLTTFTATKSQCSEQKRKGVRCYMVFAFDFDSNALNFYYHLGIYPAYVFILKTLCEAKTYLE